MGRRTSLASLAGAKVEDVPGRGDAVLLSLPLDKLHCTRFNPRRNFGSEAELREFGEKLKKEQLQPAVVVSRAGYLKLWPEEAERVKTASYVIANGERRYRASKLVGLNSIEVVHREDVAKSKADFLDAVQSENNDRKDLDPIERAIAIETMVTELGGADQVAAYYRKTKGWVSQQRKLLKLTASLQDLVSSGELPIRVARDIAGLPPQEQASAWHEQLEQRRLEKEAAAQLRARAAASTSAPAATRPQEAKPGGFTAVNNDPVATEHVEEHDEGTQDRFTAVNQSSEPADLPSSTESAPVPAPRHDQADHAASPAEPESGAAPRRLPYDDPFYVARHLHLKMELPIFTQSTRIMLGILKEQHPEVYRDLVEDLNEPEQSA